MLLLYSFESKGLMSCEPPLFSHSHGLLIRLKRYLEQEIFLESFCFRRQTSKNGQCFCWDNAAPHWRVCLLPLLSQNYLRNIPHSDLAGCYIIKQHFTQKSTESVSLMDHPPFSLSYFSGESTKLNWFGFHTAVRVPAVTYPTITLSRYAYKHTPSQGAKHQKTCQKHPSVS